MLYLYENVKYQADLRFHVIFLSNTGELRRPIYESPRMSQLVAEAMKGVQWVETVEKNVEKHVQNLEEAPLQRNGTGYPRLGQPKLWWVPAANASRPERPRLPPWAPASLLPHWPGAARPPRPPQPPQPPQLPSHVPALPAMPAMPALPHVPALPPLPPLPLWPHWPAHPDARPHGAAGARLHRTRRMLPADAALDRRSTGARQLLDLQAREQPELAGDFRGLSGANVGANAPAAGAACAQLYSSSHLALALSAASIATCLLTLLCVYVVWRRMQQRAPGQAAPAKAAEGGPLPPPPPAPSPPCPPRSDTI
jgi:hypothetical protein